MILVESFINAEDQQNPHQNASVNRCINCNSDKTSLFLANVSADNVTGNAGGDFTVTSQKDSDRHVAVDVNVGYKSTTTILNSAKLIKQPRQVDHY